MSSIHGAVTLLLHIYDMGVKFAKELSFTSVTVLAMGLNRRPLFAGLFAVFYHHVYMSIC